MSSVVAWISLNVFTLMVGAFKARQQNQDWDVASDRMNRLTSHAANNHIMKNTNPHHFSNEQLFARIIILSFSGIAALASAAGVAEKICNILRNCIKCIIWISMMWTFKTYNVQAVLTDFSDILLHFITLLRYCAKIARKQHKCFGIFQKLIYKVIFQRLNSILRFSNCLIGFMLKCTCKINDLFLIR